MTMRFFEINETNQTPDNTTKVISKIPQPADQEPQPAENTQLKYADSEQIKKLISQLQKYYPTGGIVQLKNEAASGTKQIRHLRITDVPGSDVKAKMAALGAVEQDPSTLTPEQRSTSTSKTRLGFELNGITYTIVLGASRTGTTDTGVIIEKKKTSPTKLGLGGKTFNRDQLISAATNAVTTAFKGNEPFQKMLIELINIAKNGGRGKLSPESESVLEDNYKNVSQDFGEILAPIMMLKAGDVCEFPKSGNEPLTDVKVGSTNYSIKSMSGSGTSFKSISKLMDRYEESINLDAERKKLYAPLAEFNPKKGGNNLDKIIRASNVAKTPEFVEIAKILGVTDIGSWNELTSLLEKKITSMDYPTFLNTFKSAAMAGKWPTKGGKNIQMLGFPADSAYAMGLTDKKSGKEDGAAGAPSYAANKITGAGNILVYVMGKGLEFYVQKVEGVSAQYKQMMTDIVNKSDAMLGHITVNSDGSMNVDIKPFSALEFVFQYHAPSHIAGNNLPGFAIIR
jgi:hypothetical protein